MANGIIEVDSAVAGDTKLEPKIVITIALKDFYPSGGTGVKDSSADPPMPAPQIEQPQANREADETRIAMSPNQELAIANISRRKGIQEEELQALSMERFGSAVQNLDPDQAGKFIQALQKAA